MNNTRISIFFLDFPEDPAGAALKKAAPPLGSDTLLQNAKWVSMANTADLKSVILVNWLTLFCIVFRVSWAPWRRATSTECGRGASQLSPPLSPPPPLRAVSILTPSRETILPPAVMLTPVLHHVAFLAFFLCPIISETPNHVSHFGDTHRRKGREF